LFGSSLLSIVFYCRLTVMHKILTIYIKMLRYYEIVNLKFFSQSNTFKEDI